MPEEEDQVWKSEGHVAGPLGSGVGGRPVSLLWVLHPVVPPAEAGALR